ncbi:hypothetical protein CCP3SC1AL1_110023 [Gammaproteobacteria bacterium]
MAWIKVYSELWDSWKIPTLCAALDCSEVQAVGHLISLWTFVERNRWRDGDMTKWGPEGIAKAARWQGSVEKFIDALTRAEFLNPGTMIIHEWDIHQAGMIHDRIRRGAAGGGENPRGIPAESPRNPRLDKIRLDKSREDTTIRGAGGSKKGGAGVQGPVPAWIDPTAWGHYVAMRVKIRKPLSDHAVTLAVRTLEGLSKEGHDPVKVLEQSVFNSWAGLFPLRNNGARTTGSAPVPGKYDKIGVVVEGGKNEPQRKSNS